jgi:hypothetical protein
MPDMELCTTGANAVSRARVSELGTRANKKNFNQPFAERQLNVSRIISTHYA